VHGIGQVRYAQLFGEPSRHMEHPTLNANAEITNVIFKNIAMAHAKISLTCDPSGKAGGRVSLVDPALSGALIFDPHFQFLFETGS